MYEIFNGFFSFDAKFWRTIIPLLINPGKVTKEYVAGKRTKYSNPFRFYITTSIIFFLIVGLTISKNKFDQLAKESKTSISEIVKDSTNTSIVSTIKIDSIQQNLAQEMDKYPIPRATKEKILKDIEIQEKDSTRKKKRINASIFGYRLDKFQDFQEKYPDIPIDSALDSLQLEKTFKNRFMYERAKRFATVFDNKEESQKFLSESLSYGSIALFIFLPIFTLFLRFFYIRRKFTYVDHLIFVFHTQTVFFMLLSLFFLISLFINIQETWIFVVLFLLYLFIAMKKFYQQGYIKTFFKFVTLNFVYFFLGSFGAVGIALVSFALY